MLPECAQLRQIASAYTYMVFPLVSAATLDQALKSRCFRSQDVAVNILKQGRNRGNEAAAAMY